MLSMKAKYGLKALLRLSRSFGEGPILIADLASEEAIPKKFLELILLELKQHGVLHSKKGKGGGYALAKRPADISVGAVLRVLDGSLAPVQCVSGLELPPLRRMPRSGDLPHSPAHDRSAPRNQWHPRFDDARTARHTV